VIVVSIGTGGGEVCIAYTSVLVNLWDPKHVWGYLYEYRSKQPKLVPDIFSKSVPFVPSRGDASKRNQNTLQFERSN